MSQRYFLNMESLNGKEPLSENEEETLVGEEIGEVGEIAYWKAKAEEWRNVALESRLELEEFQNESRELEGELETQLKQEEEKNKSLNILTGKLQHEKSEMKVKLLELNRDHENEVAELEGELNEIKSIKEEMDKYVRELEQQNDDLERAKRNTLASLEEFESSMNAAIERNAFLESELDEKDNLAMAVYRLKEEAKELRSELLVLNPQVENDLGTGELHRTNEDDVVQVVNNINKMGIVETPVKPKDRDVTSDAHPLSTPSARISALSIVGNCLRKIGALELKGKNRERRKASQISDKITAGQIVSSPKDSINPESAESDNVVKTN